jgi:predicted RNA binding protein YcfA (HicA-like mRNA interferase family)
MKRTDLIRSLEESGCAFIRHGGKHDWYLNPKTGGGATGATPSRN